MRFRLDWKNLVRKSFRLEFNPSFSKSAFISFFLSFLFVCSKGEPKPNERKEKREKGCTQRLPRRKMPFSRPFFFFFRVLGFFFESRTEKGSPHKATEERKRSQSRTQDALHFLHCFMNISSTFWTGYLWLSEPIFFVFFRFFFCPIFLFPVPTQFTHTQKISLVF